MSGQFFFEDIENQHLRNALQSSLRQVEQQYQHHEAEKKKQAEYQKQLLEEQRRREEEEMNAVEIIIFRTRGARNTFSRWLRKAGIPHTNFRRSGKHCISYFQKDRDVVEVNLYRYRRLNVYL